MSSQRARPQRLDQWIWPIRPDELYTPKMPRDSFWRYRNYYGANGGFHFAADLTDCDGAEVRVVADASVLIEGFDADGFGHYVKLWHPGTRLTTLYAHLKERSQWFGAGKQIRQGTKLGIVGQTGNTTGPHLHFEISQSKNARDPRVNPHPILRDIYLGQRFSRP